MKYGLSTLFEKAMDNENQGCGDSIRGAVSEGTGVWRCVFEGVW